MDTEKKLHVALQLMESQRTLEKLRLSNNEELTCLARKLNITPQDLIDFTDSVAERPLHRNAREQNLRKMRARHTLLLTDVDEKNFNINHLHRKFSLERLSEKKEEYFNSGYQVLFHITDSELAERCSEALNLVIVPTPDPPPKLKNEDIILRLADPKSIPTSQRNQIFVKRFIYYAN